MKPWIFAIPALLLFGCSSEPGNAPDGKTTTAEPKVGQLSLELLGADHAGHPYRLRNATFQISVYYLFTPIDSDAGDLSQTVSSDTNPNATSITTRLLPGSYFVTLEDGWFLEKVTGTGAERVEQSVLLSPREVYTYVYDRGNTELTYDFGVDGTLIDFRHGNLNIDFEVEHPNEDGGIVPDGG
jgi:hypothetical protein